MQRLFRRSILNWSWDCFYSWSVLLNSGSSSILVCLSVIIFLFLCGWLWWIVCPGRLSYSHGDRVLRAPPLLSLSFSLFSFSWPGASSNWAVCQSVWNLAARNGLQPLGWGWGEEEVYNWLQQPFTFILQCSLFISLEGTFQIAHNEGSCVSLTVCSNASKNRW